MSTMWYQRYKMKKVKAGVLLYALLMAAIFSLLLQFYLHRQVAGRRILKTSQERLRAYALVQLALEKRKSDEKTSEIHLKSGVVQLKAGYWFSSCPSWDGWRKLWVCPSCKEEKEVRKLKKKRRRRRKIKSRQGAKRLLKRRQTRSRNHQKIAKKTNFWYDRVRRKSWISKKLNKLIPIY